MVRIIGGARASSGLHWGHLHGCFSARSSPISLGDDDDYVFVITDRASSNPRDVEQVALDALSCAPFLGIPMTVVLETSLRSALQPLFQRISEHVSVKHLTSSLPIAVQAVDTPVNDFLFPLHQTAFTLGLFADFVYMNDDNHDVVKFGQSIARAINSTQRGYAEDYPVPQLMYPTPSRLRGYNRRRMAHGNNNFLLFSASEGDMRRFFKKAVRWSNSPNLPRESLSGFVPFEYLRLLYPQVQASKIESDYINYELDDPGLIDLLVEGYMFLMDLRQVDPMMSSVELRDRIASDTAKLLAGLPDRVGY